MEKRRVVITGIGALTPLGNTAPKSWSAAVAGQCGIAPITLFDCSENKVKLAGEVKNFDPEEVLDKREARRMARFSQLAMAAANEAMADAALPEGGDRCRWGTIVSSGIGGLEITERDHSRGLERGFDKISPFYIPMTISNMAAGLIAIEHGFRGICTSPVTACAGGGNAVGDAFRMVRDGYCEVMLCGGAEATVTPMAIGGFTSMKALSQTEDPMRASIPFDKERNGFVLGEGAGILILEEYEHAKMRGAKIYAEILGYGTTCDAYHMTAPCPDGDGGARAMNEAMRDGGISPEQVSYINAHGTSTPMNDATETAAIKTAFGAHAKNLMVSSTKSMTGHMLGATGAVEAIFTALTLRDGFVPATINYKVPDEQCDLDIVPNIGRNADVTHAISNSLGFGGHNVSLLLGKWTGV